MDPIGGEKFVQRFLERITHCGFRVPTESIAEFYPIIGALENLAAKRPFRRSMPRPLPSSESSMEEISGACAVYCW